MINLITTVAASFSRSWLNNISLPPNLVKFRNKITLVKYTIGPTACWYSFIILVIFSVQEVLNLRNNKNLKENTHNGYEYDSIP